MNSSDKKLPWTMKYEPVTVDDMCLDDSTKTLVNNILSRPTMFNMSFIGKAGIGKTTLCRVIVHNCDCDYIIHPCSIDGSIDAIKTKILSFCQMLSTKQRKIVVLDETDQLSSAAQLSLRNIICEHQNDCCFLITANEISKVHQALISRCPSTSISFSKKDVILRCVDILKKEDIKFDKEELKKFVDHVVDSTFPDIRSIVEQLQIMSSSGELKYADQNSVIENQASLKAWLERLDQPISSARKWWIENEGEFNRDYPELAKSIFNHFDGWVEIMSMVAEALWRMSFQLDKEIQFTHMTIEIQKWLKEHKFSKEDWMKGQS